MGRYYLEVVGRLNGSELFHDSTGGDGGNGRPDGRVSVINEQNKGVSSCAVWDPGLLAVETNREDGGLGIHDLRHYVSIRL